MQGSEISISYLRCVLHLVAHSAYYHLLGYIVVAEHYPERFSPVVEMRSQHVLPLHLAVDCF